MEYLDRSGDEVTGPWRQLHNDELRDVYSSPCMIRIINSKSMIWAWHVARMGEKRNAYSLFLGKTEEKMPLGRRRRRWVDNLLKLAWDDVDWISLAHNR
jgi:hypothetical protein